ncbi:MAG: tryptophan synthase subunit alpha [Oligoflexia bacterium]|nr:tryptophan synthase subunit alpha [Oligoflexia bacterium]
MKDFLAYIPAGYPDLETTEKILRELSKLGITGVEVGVPFSDPVADGPVIQKAHTAALKQGMNLEQILEMLSRLSLNMDIYLMGYLNPFLNFPSGFAELKKFLEKASVKALIIPDLPVAEFESVDIDYPKVVFAAPNTDRSAIAVINRQKPPFVYYIPRYGVTGIRDDIPFIDHIRELKDKIKSKIYMGFGISTREQVEKVWEVTDGVIVGSALVSLMETGSGDEVVKKVVNKVRELLP